jgi:hypothetical protein
METTATATLKRHSTSSMWSPRPAPAPNPLYPLLMRHWGAGKARDAMQQVLTHHSNPRMLARGGTPDGDNDLRRLPTSLGHAPPVIPKRQASLQNFVTDMVAFCEDAWAEELGQQVSPRASFSPEVANGVKRTVVSGDGTWGSTSSSGWQKEVSLTERSNGPVLNTRPAGVVGIRGWMPRLSDFATERRTSREKGSGVAKRPRETKGSGKWGWPSWF